MARFRFDPMACVMVLAMTLAAREALAGLPPKLRPPDRSGSSAPRIDPRVTSAMPADSVVNGTWDGRFGAPGPNGEVFAVAVLGSDLYIGGEFTRIGGMEANGIARWDGSRWHPLIVGAANGITGRVTALLADGDSLFVGGQFEFVAQTEVNNIAVWRPRSGSWGKVGAGASGDSDAQIAAMVKDGPDLYIAGKFAAASTVIANNVARWNGVRWSRLKSGINGLVATLAISGNRLYAGGVFTAAGTVPARNLAVWDMTVEDWSPVGGGADSMVTALAARGNELYVGGHFNEVGTMRVKNLAIWNDASRSWTPFPLPISYPPLGNGGFDPAAVYDLAVDGSTLYIGGHFRLGIEGTYGFIDSVRGLVGWDLDEARLVRLGGSVASYNNQVASYVNDVLIEDGTLYAGGQFPIAGGYEAPNVAGYRIAAGRWVSFGASVNGSSGKIVLGPTPGLRDLFGLRAVAVSGKDVYIGGYFSTAGDVATRNVVRWDGTSWSGLGEGVGGDIRYAGEFASPEHVNAVAVRGAEVVVGGRFTSAGGGPAEHIARWDGSRWTGVLGTNLAEVFAVTYAGDGLYAAGRVASSDAGLLTRRNGTGFDPVANFNRPVNCMIAVGDDLYIGGDFSSVTLPDGSTVPAAGVVRYNTVQNTWTELGQGIASGVFALHYDGGKLYAGGRFATACGAPANRIAVWDGSAWSAMGGGLGSAGAVRTITSFDGHIYAGGSFTGAPASGLAMWTGELWLQVDAGIENAVYAIAPLEDRLLVAGDFTYAGLTYAHYLALWTPTRPARVLDVDAVAGLSSGLDVSPNPARAGVSLRFDLARRMPVDLAVHDRLGRRVASVAAGDLEAGSHVIRWSPDGLAEGIYICRLSTPEGVASTRLVLLH